MKASLIIIIIVLEDRGRGSRYQTGEGAGGVTGETEGGPGELAADSERHQAGEGGRGRGDGAQQGARGGQKVLSPA